jgi:hypothetical protein
MKSTSLINCIHIRCIGAGVIGSAGVGSAPDMVGPSVGAPDGAYLGSADEYALTASPWSRTSVVRLHSL